MSLVLSRKKIRWFLVLIVIFRVLILFGLDKHTYWTFDEPWNTDTAKQVIDEGQFRRTKDSFTPISVVNVALGLWLTKHFSKIEKLTSYRVAGIVINQASVPISYAFALELGATPQIALLFAAFLGFDPNLLGHTVLASNVDGYIFTWFLLLALVAFRWGRRPTWMNLGAFGLVLGLAQGIKLTSAYALPLCLVWVVYVFWKNKQHRPLSHMFFFIFWSWFGLCLFYAFNKLGTPIGHIHFVSGPFQRLALRFSRVPAFFPVDYLQGLDMCLQTDTSPRPVYIRNTFLLHGVGYYFFYVLLLKTPLPTLASSFVGWFWAARKKVFGIQHGFVILFALAMMIYFSFFFNAQIGIRYLFPIYGFLMAGILWFPWKKVTVLLAVAWMAGSSLYNWPNDIGYFNELVWAKHHRWWHLGDSNLTWNQEWNDWPLFTSQSQLSGEQIGPPTFPINTPFYEDAITVSGILSNRQQLEVIRDAFSPIDSFWGVKLEYLINGPEVLQHFPPRDFTATPLPSQPCQHLGWLDNEEKLINQNDLFPYPFGLGQNKLRSDIQVATKTVLFLELASKNGSDLRLNDEKIITVSEPTPRLAVQTLNLEPGRYSIVIDYNKYSNDGFVSTKAFELSSNGSEVRPTIFCVSGKSP